MIKWVSVSSRSAHCKFQASQGYILRPCLTNREGDHTPYFYFWGLTPGISELYNKCTFNFQRKCHIIHAQAMRNEKGVERTQWGLKARMHSQNGHSDLEEQLLQIGKQWYSSDSLLSHFLSVGSWGCSSVEVLKRNIPMGSQIIIWSMFHGTV